ncbi:MAG: acetate uptake transporter [Candidatus Eremiobacteraeota bacterium]|nr:acetate uptake transporter [Candidatus Eremiobacteraeota bacterium]MBV8282500.1 acetate uptake transporter [Candidatus Eremiobacteraeota bacterium]
MASSSAPQVANPAPLGLAGFALTTLLLSAVNAGWITGDAWIGYALFYGGAAQFSAGMWEFAAKNTFGATAFSTYGAFWLGTAFYVWFWAGKSASVPTDLAWVTLGFTIFTGIMMVNSFKLNNPPVMWVFVALFITFLLLCLGFFMATVGMPGNELIHHAGGYVGVITALLAWYAAYKAVAASLA